MLEYVKSEINKIICNNVNIDFKVKPIGTHDNNRHFVYKIDYIKNNISHSSVLKIFYKNGRLDNEVGALKLFNESNTLIPKLINYGKLDNGMEWINIEYIDGVSMLNCYELISDSEKAKIFYQAGKQLANIHSAKNNKYFGNYDKNLKITDKKGFKKIFIEKCERYIRLLNTNNCLKKSIFVESISKLRKNYDLLDNVDCSSICHMDYHPRNWMIERKSSSNLVSIIDFEKSLFWDNEDDFSILFHDYFIKNKQLKDNFFAGYSEYLKLSSIFYEKLQLFMICEALHKCCFLFVGFKGGKEYFLKGMEILENILKENYY